MLNRLALLALFALLSACVTETYTCAERPMDSLCIADATGIDAALSEAGTVDVGTGDAGMDDGGTSDTLGPCGGRCTGTQVCLEATGECVRCIEDGDCSGTDRCDPTGHTCVACLGDAMDECPGATVCDTSNQTCVQCLTNAECTTVGASVCNAAHVCEGCNAAGECSHIAATPTCNVPSMTCVQCTATDTTACTSGICLLSTSTCAAPGGSSGPCATCTADSQCRAGQLCVPMTYDDPTTPATDPVAAGNHCLWRQDASGTGGPGGACSAVRPYLRGAPTTSVDGVSTPVCTLRVSTCESQTDFSMRNCMTLDVAGDARCGQTGVHDGVCRLLDAASNRCTVFCGSDDDCRSGFTCDTGASPAVCLF